MRDVTTIIPERVVEAAARELWALPTLPGEQRPSWDDIGPDQRAYTLAQMGSALRAALNEWGGWRQTERDTGLVYLALPLQVEAP